MDHKTAKEDRTAKLYSPPPCTAFDFHQWGSSVRLYNQLYRYSDMHMLESAIVSPPVRKRSQRGCFALFAEQSPGFYPNNTLALVGGEPCLSALQRHVANEC